MDQPTKKEAMRTSGEILHQVLRNVAMQIAPGVNGVDLDKLAEKQICSFGAKPSFKGYMGYPSSLCISVNDEVVHGIPSTYKFKACDVVSLDLGVQYAGFHTDSALTVIVKENGIEKIDPNKQIDPNILPTPQKLLLVTHNSLIKGVEIAKAGVTIGDIGATIQQYIESYGFGVVRELVGHGVGKSIHEDPPIPNFGKKGSGSVLVEGQTIAIEPMVTVGDWHVVSDPDGWTIRTVDGSLAAHFEHTILITKSGSQILT